MLNVCCDNHKEICYEGRKCPVCIIMSDHADEISGMEETIKELEKENKNLREDIITKE